MSSSEYLGQQRREGDLNNPFTQENGQEAVTRNGAEQSKPSLPQAVGSVATREHSPKLAEGRAMVNAVYGTLDHMGG